MNDLLTKLLEIKGQRSFIGFIDPNGKIIDIDQLGYKYHVDYVADYYGIADKGQFYSEFAGPDTKEGLALVNKYCAETGNVRAYYRTNEFSIDIHSKITKEQVDVIRNLGGSTSNFWWDINVGNGNDNGSGHDPFMKSILNLSLIELVDESLSEAGRKKSGGLPEPQQKFYNLVTRRGMSKDWINPEKIAKNEWFFWILSDGSIVASGSGGGIHHFDGARAAGTTMSAMTKTGALRGTFGGDIGVEVDKDAPISRGQAEAIKYLMKETGKGLIIDIFDDSPTAKEAFMAWYQIERPISNDLMMEILTGNGKVRKFKKTMDQIIIRDEETGGMDESVSRLKSNRNEILDLAGRLHDEYSDSIETPNYQEMESAIFTHGPGAAVYVYEEDGRVLGAISFHYDEMDKSLIIDHLGVMKPKSGIGTQLMAIATKYADKKGVDVTLESTPDSRKFYEKLGFVIEPGSDKVMRRHV